VERSSGDYRVDWPVIAEYHAAERAMKVDDINVDVDVVPDIVLRDSLYSDSCLEYRL
jgi:hypothetical protein